MDEETLAAAVNIMRSMPDNAAASAAAAAESATAAQEAAQSLETATVAETQEYLGII